MLLSTAWDKHGVYTAQQVKILYTSYCCIVSIRKETVCITYVTLSKNFVWKKLRYKQNLVRILEPPCSLTKKKNVISTR